MACDQAEDEDEDEDESLPPRRTHRPRVLAVLRQAQKML